MSHMRVMHIQNEVSDPCVLFTEELEAKGMEVATVHAYAGERLPDTLDGYDGMVAGGGLVDTHQAEEHPWMQQEMRLIAEAVDRSVPFIGLCLGAQLLTEATGGEVYRCEPHEIGWTPVELAPAAAGDPLFGGLPESFLAMQWHFYACRVPENGAELMFADKLRYPSLVVDHDGPPSRQCVEDLVRAVRLELPYRAEQ